MARIIGRRRQKELLERAYRSSDSELIALYGRRRVGKTYLIRTFFEQKDDDLVFFDMTGIKDGSVEEQTKLFCLMIRNAFYGRHTPITIQKNWIDTFEMLTDAIIQCPKKKIVLFFDEFPWMVTRGSRLMKTFTHYWNQYWMKDHRIKLILCGSSSGWIVKNIVKNRGGLFSRVTRTIKLKPFNLHETKAYLKHRNITLSERDIADIYMALGGIPFYLSKVESGLSAAEVIDELGFRQDSFMLNEFSELYPTLFDPKGAHKNIARFIGQHRYGVSIAQITKALKLTRGGRIITWLNELIEAGFIAKFTPYGSKRKGVMYRLIDEYSLFYFRWLEPIEETLLATGEEPGYWGRIKNSPAWYSWAGYAFESLSFKHIHQIRRTLKLTDTSYHTWHYTPKKGSNESGAQIDLLFDRKDNSITICEIKYSRQPFILDKENAEKLHRQIDVFKKQTRTKKNIFIAFVSAEGLKETIYSKKLVQNVVTLPDLFKDSE